MRILITDDEPMISDSLRRLLELLGHETAVAHDPDTALAHLQSHPTDLVLLDWLMPDGGGQRVLEALRSQGFPLNKVVLMTGSLDERALIGQPVRVLPKPFHLQALQAVLSDVESGSP